MRFYQWYKITKIKNNSYFFAIDIYANEERGLCWGFNSDGIKLEISEDVKHPEYFNEKWNKEFYEEIEFHNFDREMVKEIFTSFLNRRKLICNGKVKLTFQNLLL